MAKSIKPHVAVVGTGIVGSSIAYHLSSAGCAVTVLEGAGKPAEGATAKSWAWLNANRKSPAHYKELNKAGMAAWREVRLPSVDTATLADFPGTICIGDERDNDPAYPSTQLSADEVSRLEPGLAERFAQQGGRLYEGEGYAYATLAAKSLLQAALQGAAKLQSDSCVTDFARSGSRVTGVVTAQGDNFAADVVVLAAGLGTPALAERLGACVPLQDKPGTLTVLTQPLPKLLSHILVTDEAFIVQRTGGEVMISFFKAGANPASHPADSGAQSPTDAAPKPGPLTEAAAQQVIAKAAAICPGLEDAQLRSWSLAKYPYPVDAHPILGWLPGVDNVYVAVTHSGATLGPLLGRLVAAEVLGEPQQTLQPYRPDRDFGDLSHLY